MRNYQGTKNNSMIINFQKTKGTKKPRQSYRHADSRRQHQHTAVAARVTSNRATVTVFLTAWPWLFELWVNVCRATRPTIEYACTKFGVDSSSRFPFRAWTNRQRDKQTDATERLTHAGGYTTGVHGWWSLVVFDKSFGIATCQWKYNQCS